MVRLSASPAPGCAVARRSVVPTQTVGAEPPLYDDLFLVLG